MVMACALALAVPGLMAQDIKLSGAHYNLNIIGVEKDKKADMQDSERHTIFVGLGAPPKKPGETDSGTVETRIYLTPSQDGTFKVCDGNGFDAAVDCEGNSKSTNGAVFQLPCNTNIPNDKDNFVGCDESIAAATSYSVFARALAKPGGQAIITTCATDIDTAELVCSTESTLLVRATGKSLWQNETTALTSISAFCTDDIDFGVASCDAGESIRVSLFAGDLEEWFWKNQNNGLRLAQLRFYVND
jgi:hypothetical protein